MGGGCEAGEEDRAEVELGEGEGRGRAGARDSFGQLDMRGEEGLVAERGNVQSALQTCIIATRNECDQDQSRAIQFCLLLDHVGPINRQRVLPIRLARALLEPRPQQSRRQVADHHRRPKHQRITVITQAPIHFTPPSQLGKLGLSLALGDEPWHAEEVAAVAEVGGEGVVSALVRARLAALVGWAAFAVEDEEGEETFAEEGQEAVEECSKGGVAGQTGRRREGD